MSPLEQIPLWAAIPVALLLVIGSGLTLIGAIGLVRFQSFYERLHAPTLGTSWGTAGIIGASMLFFSVLGHRVVLHELLIGTFVMITTPVTLMLLGRSAVYRDRSEGQPGPDAARAAERLAALTKTPKVPVDEAVLNDHEPDPAADIGPDGRPVDEDSGAAAEAAEADEQTAEDQAGAEAGDEVPAPVAEPDGSKDAPR